MLIAVFVYHFIGLARAGESPPPGFMAEKAWDVLARYYRALNNN
jgi:3'-phosphoadenosine 5'-phosphosulfate synthase